jgi:signal transduction histidine kinase
MCDSGQLEQAFLNLILNATEAMPRGGSLTIIARSLFTGSGSRSARAAPSLSPSEGERAGARGALPTQPTHIAVEFKDTGQGMTEAQRRRAADSVLNTTKTKGTGLGLPIVTRIVETHRGRLKIKSRPGHGTTVSIILPL